MFDLREYEPKKETIDVPGFGTVEIRELPASTMVEIQLRHRESDGQPVHFAAELYVDLIAACVVDESGNRYLNNENGIATISQLPWTIVEPLGKACSEMHGLLDEKKSS